MIRTIRQHDQTVASLEAGAYDIVERLNNAPDKPEVKRIGEMLMLFSRLIDDERGVVRRKLVQMLRPYQWASRVVLTSAGFGIVSFNRAELTKSEKWEHDAIYKLLRTLHEDGKPRIRPCDDKECPRWFYAAKRVDQRFCSDNCKQHDYDSDPDRRAEKAAYMREHRAEAKRRLLNRKNGVGLRVKSRKST